METTVNKMPLIGDPAPSFKAVTTQGEISFPEDYTGKWVILFSHPADFTPVCTTEFMTFATMADEFRALNTELIGLSVDSLYAHIAWLRKIQELEWNGMKNVDVQFPLIEDIKMDVANKYGMIQPGQSNTQAVRASSLLTLKQSFAPFCTIHSPWVETLTRLSGLSSLCKRLTRITWPHPQIGDPGTM